MFVRKCGSKVHPRVLSGFVIGRNREYSPRVAPYPISLLILEEQVAFPDMHHRGAPLGGVVAVSSALEAFPGRPFPLDFTTSFTNLFGSRRGNKAFFIVFWPVGMQFGSVKDGTVVIAKNNGIHNRCSDSDLFWSDRCDYH